MNIKTKLKSRHKFTSILLLILILLSYSTSNPSKNNIAESLIKPNSNNEKKIEDVVDDDLEWPQEASINSQLIDELQKTYDAISWWNDSWNYRVRVEIKAQDKDISDVPIEKRLNFTYFLQKYDDFNKFDENSIRVIEYNISIDKWTEIPCVVNKYLGEATDGSEDYNETYNALVDVFWIMNGTTFFGKNRTYFIYFDSQAYGIKPKANYGYGYSGPGTYTDWDTGNLIYGDFFRIADFSACNHSVGTTHDGDKDNPFDDVYGYPIIDEVDDYEGKVGKVRDIIGRQAHAGIDIGIDEGHNTEFYWNSPNNEPEFPILKIAMKAEYQSTHSVLYIAKRPYEGGPTVNDWKGIMYTPAAKNSQGDDDILIDKNYGCEIICDGKWRIYEYNLKNLPNEWGTLFLIEFYEKFIDGTNDFYFDNLIAMKANDKTIEAINRNYLIPESFIYEPEKIKYNVIVNAIDLYGNGISGANISIYNKSKQYEPLKYKIGNSNGSVYFSNLNEGEYNFSVSITSNIIKDHTELVNITKKAIIVNKFVQIINLTCIVSTNIFNVADIDEEPVESGWIIVGNSSENFGEIQNCSIDSSGNAKFWWINSTPYEYNYTVYYQNINYDPKIIKLASGNINTPNSLISISVLLTRVNFTILTSNNNEPIEGVKIILRVDDILGRNIVNLSSDENGKATLRWLNSSGINGDYSLQIEFFGKIRIFNITNNYNVEDISFTVNAKFAYEIKINILLEDYETKLISLNPLDTIQIDWGTQLKLRVFYNITKAKDFPIGPTYVDKMIFTIIEEEIVVLSGKLEMEIGKIGYYQGLINTKNLESDKSYVISILAQKYGFFTPPTIDIELLLENAAARLRKPNNFNFNGEVYWSENITVAIRPYGYITENFIAQDSFSIGNDVSFEFLIPDVINLWNLTTITFNIYNVTHGPIEDMQLNITDPYNIKYSWDQNNITNYYRHPDDAGNGTWHDLVINLNKGSPTNDNKFNFTIEGVFTNPVDIIADTVFKRDKVKVEYLKFNVTNSISIPSDSNGWAIESITFEIKNFRNSTDNSLINPFNVGLNITTNEDFKYSINSADCGLGIGNLTIDDRIIYPIGDQFLFIIENNTSIIFDTIIKVEYVQQFYCNQYLEILNFSESVQDFSNGMVFQIKPPENQNHHINKDATLYINEIKNQLGNYVFPSEVEMSIRIGGVTYEILDNQVKGFSTFKLNQFNKSVIYDVIIIANQDISFNLLYQMEFFREVYFQIYGNVTYYFSAYSWNVQFYDDLGYYQHTVDTSLTYARVLTTRISFYKDHYSQPNYYYSINIKNRLTLINGKSTSDTYKLKRSIYLKDSVIFTFIYTDLEKGTRLTNLQQKSYIWVSLDKEGFISDAEVGTLSVTNDNKYVLDFDTELRSEGEYLISFVLGKTNYIAASIQIRLLINSGKIDYKLGDNFETNKVTVVKGEDLTISIELTDPNKGDIPISGAKVVLEIEGKEFEFDEVEPGIYEYVFSTEEYNTFYNYQEVVGVIKITKEGYTTTYVDITIIIEMEQVIPGIPTFYLLLIIGAIGVVLIIYKINKYSKKGKDLKLIEK